DLVVHLEAVHRGVAGDGLLLGPCAGREDGAEEQDQYGSGSHRSSFRYLRRIFSIGLPFASSSTSLSRYRIFRISGSSISSMRTPQITPVILAAFGCRAGAWAKKVSRSVFWSICSASVLGV